MLLLLLLLTLMKWTVGFLVVLQVLLVAHVSMHHERHVQLCYEFLFDLTLEEESRYPYHQRLLHDWYCRCLFVDFLVLSTMLSQSFVVSVLFL